ncbi:hypothetical protein I4U23_025044 [Adineta vaga]|nr:hypothetical protein I4U23_025044 [Adineta vaga]
MANFESSSSDREALSSPLSKHTYMGRYVTYERPVLHKSRSSHHRYFQPNEYVYEEGSSDDDYDPNKPLGIIKINNQHIREIYRIPTPPPETRQVYHRARSPKPKIIERVYVRRPPRQIIENVVQVPPQKTEIVHREKVLRASKPIIRTKYVYLKPEDEQYQQQQQQQTVYPSFVNLQSTATNYTQSMTPTYVFSRQIVNPQIIPSTCYSYSY